MAFWANYCLLGTKADPANPNVRNGAEGLLRSNETRGFGWAVRNLADTAAYLPDGDSRKSYLAEKLHNNLVWLDNFALTPGPLGVAWKSTRRDTVPQIRVATWEHLYLAWAIERANFQGFDGGTSYLVQIATFQNRLFNSDPQWPKLYGAPSSFRIGTQGSPDTHYQTLGQCYQVTFVQQGQPATQFAGYYGPETRLLLLTAIRLGLPGAQAAHDYLYPFIAVQNLNYNSPDLKLRPGWALAQEEIDMPKTVDIATQITTVPAGDFKVKTQLLDMSDAVIDEAISAPFNVPADPPSTPNVETPTVTVS